MISVLDDQILKFASREAWLEHRIKSIGASDAATILGCNPYSSAYSLWHQMFGTVEPDDLTGNDAVKWGRRLELPIIDGYCEDYDCEVHLWDQCSMVRHRDLEWMTCTPDAIQFDDERGPGVIECKSVGIHSFARWPEGCPPLMYEIQVQHQLAVTGFDWGNLVVLVGGQRLEVFPIARNDTFIEATLIPRLRAFRDSLESGEEPVADGTESTRQTLAAVYEDYMPGKTVELPWQLFELDEQYIEHTAALKDHQAKLDEIKNRIKQEIGEAEEGIMPTSIWTWKERKMPERVLKASSSRVLTRKELK